jgi:predicted flap endonuclease-1-like 5' DNA nuclease
LAKKSDIPAPQNIDLSQLAKKSDLNDLARKADVKFDAPKIDLSNIATKNDLAALAKKSDIPAPQNIDLSNIATKSDLADVVRTTDLERLRPVAVPTKTTQETTQGTTASTKTIELSALSSEATALKKRFLSSGVTIRESRCPQHLSDCKGIGTVFEGRLYRNGIGTFWELSQLSDAELKKYLDIPTDGMLRIDGNEIRNDAARLAKETKAVGRTWTMSEPDDFEPLTGIGFVFEKRLYDAGICTFEQLATQTPEQLKAICVKKAMPNEPDFALWVNQAKAELQKSRNG